MPRLPTLDDLGQRPSPNPQLGVAPVDLSAPAHALASVGDAIGQIDAHLTEARRATDLTDALSSATQALGEQEIGFQRDPDFKTVPQRFGQVAAQIGQDRAGQITDPTVRQVFQREYQKLAVAKQLGVTQFAAKQEADYHAGQLETNLQTIAQQAANAKTDLERQVVSNQAKIAIGETRAARWITEEHASRLEKQFDRTYEEALVTRDMGDDPVGTYNRLKNDPQYGINIDPIVRARILHWAAGAALPYEMKKAADTVMSSAPATMPGEKGTSAPATTPTPGLINAMVAQESGGNQAAVSPKGAVGVMQLMPDAAADAAKSLGVPLDMDRVRTDAAYNQQLGTEYMRMMLDRFGGNRTLALAAYNAGPGSVEKWIGTIGDPTKGAISDADFAAKIPFKETRDYVARVDAAAPAAQGDGAEAPTQAHDTRAMLPAWISAAEREAERLHPGDPTFRDHLISEVKGRVATISAAQQAVQTQAHDTLLTRLAGLDKSTDGAKPLTLSDLLSTPEASLAWSRLDGPAQAGIVRGVQQNQVEAEGKPARENARLVQELFTRMYLPSDDPNAITQATQLTPYIAKGLTPQGHGTLVAELAKLKNPEGRDFQVDLHNAIQTGHGMLTRSLLAFQPDIADEAAYRFRVDLQNKVDQYRKEGRDPRDLITPGKPDYALDPKRVQSFLPSMKDAVKSVADAERVRTTSANAAPAPEVAGPPAPEATGNTADMKARVVQEGRAAIAGGASRKAVEARLHALGIDPARLDDQAPPPDAPTGPRPPLLMF
jgi:hypothetical protein